MTFQVGTSGNPNGKPAGTKSQTTIMKNRQRIAVQVLENLMTDTGIEPGSGYSQRSRFYLIKP